MTKRDKFIILCSIAIALCLIIGIICAPSLSQSNSKFWLYSVPVMVISLLAILAVYLFKIQKGKYEKMLNSEYYQKYETIRDIVMNSQISNDSKKEIKDDILDMLISAQEAGKTADNVVNNPVDFAENIIKSYFLPERIVLLTLLDGIIFSIIFILLANGVLWLENIGENFFSTRIDVGLLVVIFFVSFIVIPTSNKPKSNRSISTYLLPLIITIVFILLLGIFANFFSSYEFVEQLHNGSVNMIPNTIILVIYLIAIPTCIFLKAFIRKIFR